MWIVRAYAGIRGIFYEYNSVAVFLYLIIGLIITSLPSKHTVTYPFSKLDIWPLDPFAKLFRGILLVSITYSPM